MREHPSEPSPQRKRDDSCNERTPHDDAMPPVRDKDQDNLQNIYDPTVVVPVLRPRKEVDYNDRRVSAKLHETYRVSQTTVPIFP